MQLNKSNYKSGEQRLNLSRSQQQGHSATYNTLFKYLSRMQRIYPLKHYKLKLTEPRHAYSAHPDISIIWYLANKGL